MAEETREKGLIGLRGGGDEELPRRPKRAQKPSTEDDPDEMDQSKSGFPNTGAPATPSMDSPLDAQWASINAAWADADTDWAGPLSSPLFSNTNSSNNNSSPLFPYSHSSNNNSTTHEDESTPSKEEPRNRNKKTDEEKRADYLLRNKIAARKHRERKKHWLAKLTSNLEQERQARDFSDAQLDQTNVQLIQAQNQALQTQNVLQQTNSALQQTQNLLNQARNDLRQRQHTLQQTQGNLKEVTRERDELQRRVANLEAQIAVLQQQARLG